MRRKGFGRDEDGAVLVFVGISLAVFLGLVALSFDLGRLAVTNSDLQSYADSVALAAAAELDGRPDAITRATTAAQDLIADNHTFGTGDRTLAGSLDYTLVFLTGLPAADTTPLPDGRATTDPAVAGFAWVTVADVEVDQGFARAFRTLSGAAHTNPRTSATAVAGMTQMACDLTPMMFCLPPPTAADTGGVWKADAHRGEMIHLRAQSGQGAAWQPGNFGFLDLDIGIVDPSGVCASVNGTANVYRCLIAASRNVSRCVSTRGVGLNPGQSVGLNRGINTRFDLYTNVPNDWRSNPAFAPAPNVTKGERITVSGAGNPSCPTPAAGSRVPNHNGATPPVYDSLPLLRDTCIVNGTCGRFGDGTWDRTRYLSVNHRNPANPATWTDPVPAGGYPSVEPGSRYEMYLAETERAYGTPHPAPTATPTGRPLSTAVANETGLPICTASGRHAGSDRRVLIAAGIDCSPGYSGNATNVPVAEYVSLFLTEPMGESNESDIYAEVIGSVGGDGSGNGGIGGVFRDVVQLYR